MDHAVTPRHGTRDLPDIAEIGLNEPDGRHVGRIVGRGWTPVGVDELVAMLNEIPNDELTKPATPTSHQNTHDPSPSRGPALRRSRDYQ
jgi:hypothetical protein